MLKGRKGFTMIEILMITAIVVILTVVSLITFNNSKRKARINTTKSVLKTTLPVIISCKDSGGTVNIPLGNESDGNKLICSSGFPNSYWPKLTDGYSYGSTMVSFNTVNCNFDVFTNGDSDSNIVCNCSDQKCN